MDKMEVSYLITICYLYNFSCQDINDQNVLILSFLIWYWNCYEPLLSGKQILNDTNVNFPKVLNLSYKKQIVAYEKYSKQAGAFLWVVWNARSWTLERLTTLFHFFSKQHFSSNLSPPPLLLPQTKHHRLSNHPHIPSPLTHRTAALARAQLS